MFGRLRSSTFRLDGVVNRVKYSPLLVGEPFDFFFVCPTAGEVKDKPLSWASRPSMKFPL